MKTTKGVTVIELMIVVAIVGILAAIAVVLYSSQVMQARRSDGVDSLVSLSLAEERYRANNVIYGTLAQVWGGVTASTGGYYALSITNVSATAYTLTATAQGGQATDTEGATSCASLQLTFSSGTVTKTPSICWP
jgi:type IV pilus assembly protein PilE